MSIRRFLYTWRGYILLSLMPTFLFSLASCKQPDTWEEPVADYFDKYTNTAAIEKHNFSCGYEKDKNGNSCISSNGDKTVTFYLRNPRGYNLIPTFSDSDSGVSVTQSTSDKTVIYVTYPESYLLEHECGGEIGGTIGLQEEETLRSFESYHFNLKCNTPPPGVKGQMVNTSAGKYILCFYLPTTELSSARHSGADGSHTHKLFINGTLIKEGTASQIMAESISRPTPLYALEGGSIFSSTHPSGYEAFYYNTNTEVQANDNLSWKVRIEDEHGLSSRTVTASTKVTEVALTLTGTNVFAEGDADATFTANMEEGSVTSWNWSVTPNGIVSVDQNPDARSAKVTPLAGGEATVTVQAELADGRIHTKEMQVSVLGMNFADTNKHFLKGQTGVSLDVNFAGFPDSQVYTWTSSNESVATVNSSGGLTLKAKGKATINVSASYGGKTVSKSKEIVVHEVKLTGDDFVFAQNGKYVILTPTVESPAGESVTGITYTCTSNLGTAAPQSGGKYKFSSTTNGTATVTLTASLNGKTTTVTKQVTVYSVAINSTNPLISKSATSKTLTATITPTPPSGYFTYSWTSGAPGVATVSGTTADGSVVPVAAGKSQIAFTVKKDDVAVGNAYQDVYVIAVTGLKSFLVGETTAPRALTVAPTGISGGPTYSWESRTTTKASVNNTSEGKITPLAEGNATIRCTATLGSYTLPIDTTIKIADLVLSNLDSNGEINMCGGERVSVTYGWPSAFKTTATLSETGATGLTLLTSDNRSFVTYPHVSVTITADSGLTSGRTAITLSITQDGTTVSKLVYVNFMQRRTVAYSDLSTYLASLPANDKDHPYKLDITGLSASDVTSTDNNGSPCPLSSLIASSGKFVDLSQMTLPLPNDSNLNYAFIYNTKLVAAPKLPNSLRAMSSTFYGCTNLKTPPPSIPNTVTLMACCFWDCSKLETPPVLSSLSGNIGGCFHGCTKLQSAPVIPSSVNDMENAFQGCTSLTGTVTVNANITDSAKWKNAFDSCTNITSVVVQSNAVKNAITSATGNSAVNGKITVP